MTPPRPTLRARLLAFIASPAGESFDGLALSLFAYQYENNAAYRRYCDAIGQTPASVGRWEDIPAAATEVFRHALLFCGAREEAAHVFRTSGTTSGKRGEHHLRELAVYHASALAQIDRWLLPSGPRPAILLAPAPEEAPDSSLSSMLGLIREERACGQARFTWADGRLDVEAAIAALGQAADGDQPVQVLATSFAFVAVLDAMADRGLTLALPEGSIAMPTGGTKGRTREVAPAEIEQALIERLGLARSHIVAEYGMTELGSQFYDPRLAAEGEGAAPAEGRSGGRGALLAGPPWCRTLVVDALTGERLAAGQEGLLRFVDLANLDSVAAVQTSDRGRVVVEGGPGRGDTIELYGRAPGAVPRGCSLTIEGS